VPPVSVLDLSPVAAGRGETAALRETLDLARRCDELGYHRFWLAEHHGGAMVSSSAPEIMIAAVAGATERMRIGAGGIMLPNHNPFHVAEQFKVLEALHPGRIDLGIGRAPGTDQLTALALRRSREALDPDLPELLSELLAFAGARPWPEGHPFARVHAAPGDAPLPPVFLLGSSDYSAWLAASAGIAFAFAGQINPAGAVEVLRLYRSSFEPSPELREPLSILCHNAICAPTDEEARRLAAPARVAFRRLRAGRPTPLPTVPDAVAEDRPPRAPAEGIEGLRMIVGAPPTVREILDELAGRSGADELMLMASTHDAADRVRSYELLAEAFELSAQPAA
jgi:luciferase family oxidoreductase group 1